jgi:hypothetical protein
MLSMAIDRRRFLAGLAAATALPAGAARALGRDDAHYLTIAAAAGGGFEAVILDRHGEPVCSAVLPGRGHGGAWCPRRRHAVVFARRPGTFALVIDPACGRTHATVIAPEDRHFYGHGTFSPDGGLLYTTENDLARGRGVIGVWDAGSGYARVGELDSGGIGPHDLALAGDGRTLVVANGGILTHPDTGRAKLNVADMDPSLAFLDLATGRVDRRLRLAREFHKLSIRHIALNGAGRIGVAMQYEGPKEDPMPLVLLCDGGRLDMLGAPEAVARRMKGYCGDVAMDAVGTTMAVSAPRGGLVTFWSVADGRFLGETPMADGCGVAPAGGPGHFLLTGGTGERVLFDLTSGEARALAPTPGRRWDNHVLAVGSR